MLTHHRAGKRFISLFMVLMLLVAMLPTDTFADTAQSVSIQDTEITTETTAITVNLTKTVTQGFMRIFQLDSSETYNPDNFFSYDTLATVGFADLTAGTIKANLDKQPTAGSKIIAVLRDSSTGSMTEYLSDSIAVQAGGSTSTPNENEILSQCSVNITGFDSGKIQENTTEITANVKLHSSVESCYLIVAAYPGNAVFDPDVSVTKRLAEARVSADGEYKLTLKSDIQLVKGQKLCAYLNVPVGEDNYKIVRSQDLDVVDENGEGFADYTYPEAHIDTTDGAPQAGDETVKVSLSGDSRLFQYAADPNTNYDITLSIQQYPADEKFDFEGEYMHPLISPTKVTAPFTNREFQLSEPLKEGYRVRAVVYWSQNDALWIPKSNDYEAAGIPDDSILIPTAPVAPSVTIDADYVKAGASSVKATVNGDLPEDAGILFRQYSDDVYDHDSSNNLLFASQFGNLQAGQATYTKSAYGRDLVEGNKLIAVLMSSGNVIAQSEPINIVAADFMKPTVLQAAGAVYAGDKTVNLKADYDADITTGKIYLYKADARGTADPWDESTRVGEGSLATGDNIKINVTGSLNIGDIIVPYIYHYDSVADTIKYYPGTAFTVQEKILTDNLTFAESEFTTASTTAHVQASGYDEFIGGRLILTINNAADQLDGSQLAAAAYTGADTYTLNFSSDRLTKGQYITAYLYKYDADNDFTMYSELRPSIQIAGSGVKDSVLEITTSSIKESDTSAYIKADFEDSFSGVLEVYSYSGSSFNITDTNNTLLYSQAVTPAASAQKITFSQPLAAGNKIIAVLKLSDTAQQTTAITSEPKTIQAAPQIKTPTLAITEAEISEGDVNMKGYIDFEKNYYDEVSYTVYNYTGDTLNTSTAVILAANTLYSPPGSAGFYFKNDALPLTAGSKIVIQLTTKLNGESQTYTSAPKEVLPAPSWATPTVSIDLAAVRENAAEIPVTLTYDRGYLDIVGGYYCNVTAYQFPASYTDAEFEKQELHESTITQRLGAVNSTEDNQYLTTINIPVKADTLKAGDRVIVKLRLPHPEWEGEEADYLSISVPVIGADDPIPTPKVLLYNLDENTANGKKLRSVLADLGIEAVTVEKSQIYQTVGYLAGKDGFEANDREYTGDGYTTEFMLMSSLSETQLDKLLAAMNTADVSIDHKAVLTDINQYWEFYELIDEIEKEHEIFQAILELNNIITKAEKLKANDYTAEEWAPFAAALDNANAVLQQAEPEPTAAEYLAAADALQSEYNKLKPEEQSKPSSSSSGGSSGKPAINQDSVKNEEEEATPPKFTDVPDDSYYKQAVDWAIAQGVTTGTSDTAFTPNAYCTRAEIITMLWRAAGSPQPSVKTSAFTDVSENAYYRQAVIWATEKGITTGTENSVFQPDAICTRAQIITFLWRSAGQENADGINTFHDVAPSAYFCNAASWAAENNIAIGTEPNIFAPNNNCSRAQAITFLHRYLTK